MSVGAALRHPVLRQWCLLLVGSIATVILLCASKLFWRLDLAIYDASLPTGPAPSEVLIVAIDDASVSALGRFPWRRAVHASLLDRLRQLGARAVALDLVLTEPDTSSANGDSLLATAMSSGLPVVLPIIVEPRANGASLQAHLPIASLATASARLGHANLELDRDGIARSVFLREGLGTPSWSHFALALLESTPGEGLVRLRGARHPDLAGAGAAWVRDYQMMIPYLGPPGHFVTVSYVDVLRGKVAAGAVHGKFVLVGATAQGLGDAYPTPRSGEGRAMPGVEISANVLQALRAGTMIRPLPLAWTIFVALILVFMAFLGFLRLGPRQALMSTAALWLATVVICASALRFLGWWWPPSATLVVLIFVYPLWSWRRLEATQVFLEEEFARFSQERLPLLGGLTRTEDVVRQPLTDFVQHRIDLLRNATARLRDVRALFADTIRSLPDATVLVDQAGRIVLANPAAATLFESTSSDALEGQELDQYLLRKFALPDTGFAVLAAQAPLTIEVHLAARTSDLLLRAVPFFDRAGHRLGTLIDLADITQLRTAQRERDDAIRFLSHDMKSPASSLLGLAALQRDPSRALPAKELSQRLDLLAQRTLTLADGFIAVARAEASDPRSFQEFFLEDAVQDALDEVWASAQEKGIGIDAGQAAAPGRVLGRVLGDRQLFARAIANLLNNAVKFSPTGATVRLSSTTANNRALVTVTDCGPGIAPAQQTKLFQRFARGLHRGERDPGGAGLGLALVRTAVEKHGGRVWVESPPTCGARFCMSVPLVGPPTLM